MKLKRYECKWVGAKKNLWNLYVVKKNDRNGFYPIYHE